MIFKLIIYGWWRFFIDKSKISQAIVVNDAQIYFEAYCKGQPVILLHGGLTSVEACFAQLPTFANRYKVIAIEKLLPLT
jgi:hypothetical protein